MKKYSLWIIACIILGCVYLGFSVLRHQYIFSAYVNLSAEDTAIKSIFQKSSWSEIYSGSITLSKNPSTFSVNRKYTALFVSTTGCIDVGYIEKHKGIARGYTIADKIIADQKKLGIDYDDSIGLNFVRKVSKYIKPIVSNLTYAYQPLLYYPQPYKLGKNSMVSDILDSDIGFDTGFDTGGESKFITLLFYNQYFYPTEELRTSKWIKESLKKQAKDLHLCNFSGYIIPIKYPVGLNQDTYYTISSQSGTTINFRGATLSSISQEEKIKFIKNID